MDNQKNQLPRKTIRNFVEWWNSNFPLDVWYRDRFRLRFNSPEHRQTSLLDMRFDFEEALLEVDSRKHRKDKIKKDQLYKMTGKWLGEREVSSSKIDEAFDNLDITKL